MKFDSAPLARRRALEAAQCYRGLTFTDRGEILLDVGNVKNGRVRLSQGDQQLSLLPETIFSVHQAWRDGDIPPNGVSWECSTFSTQDSETDEVRCLRVGDEQMRISDKRSKADILISREQINEIVECIVDPWLANLSQEGVRAETPTPGSQTKQSKTIPVADLS